MFLFHCVIFWIAKQCRNHDITVTLCNSSQHYLTQYAHTQQLRRLWLASI